MAVQRTIEVGADVSKATSTIKKFSKDASKSLNGIEKSFGALKSVAVAAVGVLVGRQIVRGINAITEAASIQEDAIKQLNTALQLSGDFSQSASEQMQNFASELQSVTTIGDEAAIRQLALAKSFGVTNDQAQNLVQAAADLSAATGITLDSAVRNLGKTFGGLTGELGEVVPALKDLTKEQLIAGEAVDFINQRFGGAAQQIAQTFSGAVQQTSNIIGDFQESLGAIITQNPIFIDSIQSTGSAFSDLAKLINDNRQEIIDFINEGLIITVRIIREVARGAGFLIDVFAKISAVFNDTVIQILKLDVAWAQFLLSFDTTHTIVNSIINSFQGLFGLIIQGIGGVTRLLGEFANFAGIDKNLKQLGVDVKNLGSEIENFGKDLQQNLNEDYTEELQKGLEQTNKLLTAAEKQNAEFFNGISVGATLTKDIDSILEKLEGLSKKRIVNLDIQAEDADQGGFLNDIGKTFSNIFSSALSSFKELTFDNAISGIVSTFDSVAGVLSGVFSGQPVTALTATVSSLSNFPSLLLNSFKNLSQIVDDLLNQIPIILKDFLDELPAIAKSIADQFPELVKQIASALPQVAQAIADVAPELARSFVRALPELIRGVSRAIANLISAIPEILDEILRGLPDIIQAIAEALPVIARAIADVIAPIFETIAQNLPDIIISLIEGLAEAVDQIIVAFIDALLIEGGLERIIKAFITAVPRIALALAEGFVNAAGNIVVSLGDEIAKGFKAGLANIGGDFADDFKSGLADFKVQFDLQSLEGLEPKFITDFRESVDKLFNEIPFVKEFRETVDKLLNFNLGDLTGGQAGGFLGNIPILGGGSSGPLEGTGISFGQDGGVVPGGFNENFIAGLSSKELVVPATTTEDLFKLISNLAGRGGQDTERNLVVNLQVGEQQLADVLLSLNNRGFRTA